MSTDTIQKPEGPVAEVVRRMLAERSINRTLSVTSNLSDLGLTSFDMVELVLTLESALDLNIPETHITPAHFRSIATIDALLATLQH